MKERELFMYRISVVNTLTDKQRGMEVVKYTKYPHELSLNITTTHFNERRQWKMNKIEYNENGNEIVFESNKREGVLK